MSTSFGAIESRAVALPIDNVDTDQITPARFLKVTDKEGLADALFADWRREAGFVLNRPEARGAQVLVAGANFGCGSSREHAPWALVAWGFRAVVALSFADIFRNNALKNGLLPVAVDAAMQGAILARPDARVRVDLETQTVGVEGGPSARFEVDAFARHCLLQGVDELGYLLSHAAEIAAFEQAHGG